MQQRHRDCVDLRAAAIEPFPGVIPSLAEPKRRLSVLTLKESFTCTEYMSIISRVLYIMLDVLCDEEQEIWLLHVEFLAGYHQEEWTPEQRSYRVLLRKRFLRLLTTFYQVMYFDLSLSSFRFDIDITFLWFYST